MNTQWLFFKDLTHTKVREASADKTGSLDNAVVDLQTGHLVLYTLGSGGFLGMGENRVALPPRALHFGADEARLTVSPDLLRDSPGSADNWPERIDSPFVNDVHRHYGFKPYSAD